MASSSACASADLPVSRRLRPRPTIRSPSVMMHPTGTSPSSAASPASAIACRIYSSSVMAAPPLLSMIDDFLLCVKSPSRAQSSSARSSAATGPPEEVSSPSVLCRSARSVGASAGVEAPVSRKSALTPNSRAIFSSSAFDGSRRPCSYIPTALGLISRCPASSFCDQPDSRRSSAIRAPNIKNRLRFVLLCNLITGCM